ncbi:hypothetical protein [Mycolicibacterium goodii]|uniref:hypothetical protein n=1 Tax=Mycolicibacterium goodii TaxID=134601 RepID=UPI001BDCC97E|nr:hypothetical protein [Mycolicibacterium goodii]MBU8834464.1 hypothetical protein [Mycolicibacterium goodii]
MKNKTQTCPGSGAKAERQNGPWRGICPNCGKQVQVKLDGTFRRHGVTREQMEAWRQQRRDETGRQAGWLNEPKHAETRRNLLGCIDFIQRMAAKPPLWQLPDNPMTLFNVDEFYPRWTLHGPGRFEIPDDLTLTVTCPHWAPAGDRAEPPQRQPAKWDGRPFPGKCDVDDCDNQATNTVGYWDGGAPGAGTWHQHGRCPNHDPTMEFTPTGLDEFNPDTTWNPEIPR